MVRFVAILACICGAVDTLIAQVGDDAVQDVGPAVAALGFRRFLVQTGKYRQGDEDRLEQGEGQSAVWVGADFVAAVEAILAE